MTIKIIAPSVCLMLLISISGVAQDEVRQYAKDVLAKATDPEANTQEAPGLFDAEIQRETKDLLARQRAEAPAGRNPLSNRANNQGRSNLAPAGIANRTQATSPFARSMFASPSKLAKINQETASGVHAIVNKIKKSEDDEEKQELKNEIQQLLDAQYDAYLDHHEEPLKQLEERLIKLRDEFEARKKAKADLVKLRLDTVWYDAIGLGWPSNANGAAGYLAPRYQNQSTFAPSAVWQIPSANRALSPRTNTLPPPPGLAVPYLDGTQPAEIPTPPKSGIRPPDSGGDVLETPDRPNPPTRPGRSGGR